MNPDAPFPAPLIDAPALLALLAGSRPPRLLDASFDLADPALGERQYRDGHLPGARYVHLDRDLSAPNRTAPDGRFRGRHPLPERAAFAATVGALGIASDTPVVVYDRQGATFAVRAWWMLRWLGHDAVALLDGGFGAWVAAGGAVESGAGAPRRADAPPYHCSEARVAAIDADALAARLGRVALLDARAAERFRGEVEPLDAKAGHIPGARNRFYKDNLDAGGRFKDGATLRAEFARLLGATPPADVVHQCGSGVIACHNLLAMEIAGLGGSALYPGSWSEWSSDPARPVAVG